MGLGIVYHADVEIFQFYIIKTNFLQLVRLDMFDFCVQVGELGEAKFRIFAKGENVVRTRGSCIFSTCCLIWDALNFVLSALASKSMASKSSRPLWIISWASFSGAKSIFWFKKGNTISSCQGEITKGNSKIIREATSLSWWWLIAVTHV